MKVSIVIPNYNGKNFMEPCMKALERQTMQDFEVIVVDNASTDGSIEFIEKKYPNIRLLKMEENLGFAGGVNVGIRAARAPYVLLLNNDTECFPDFVKRLYYAIKRDKKIFSVSSKMICLHDPSKVDSAGDLYSILGWAFNRGSGKPVENYEASAPIFTACAGAAIYRKSIFEKIGYFDEQFFAYREDIDIGYRARIYGYRNIYCPKAQVYHVGSGTSGSTHNSFKVKLGVRNNIYVNYKNMPLFFLTINLPFLLAGYLIKWIYFVKKGFGKEYAAGFIEGFRTICKLKKVPFHQKNLWNYVKIQGQLYVDTIRILSEMYDKVR